MSDVPEVMMRKTKSGYSLFCDSIECPYTDTASNYREAEDKELTHKRWHENGMPE